jgi:hypothetical integral membrane protein (TIGR02206 family)
MLDRTKLDMAGIASMPPFVAYSTSHVVALVIVLTLCVSLPPLIKLQNSERVTWRAATALGVVLLASKLLEPIVNFALSGPSPGELPLHLCDITGILAGILLINRSYRLYEITYFWAMGGTSLALVTPELENGFPHFDYYFYFFSHGMVIVGVVFATRLFGYRPTFNSIWSAFFATTVCAAAIAPVNWLLGTNFLYLCAKPHNATLFDYLGPWPWYVLSAAPVILAIFFVCYSPFWIAERIAGADKRRV